MDSIGLNNLEQYFTIIYTMSFPSHMLNCFMFFCFFLLYKIQNPILYVIEFCWFPFKLWLVSQMYKKLVCGWLHF